MTIHEGMLFVSDNGTSRLILKTYFSRDMEFELINAEYIFCDGQGNSYFCSDRFRNRHEMFTWFMHYNKAVLSFRQIA